ncbi:MAG TPA: TonB family protein [Candidatus Acidoferrales bacterium]|nr:TonB family protein [Candidatus Acidoferrales bacterium]
MPTQTTDIPFSPTATKTRASSESLEAEAIGLEVPVRITGTQVTAVVMGTTEHAEPFQEETSTMIVFPRGAVVKLLARVRTGQSVELTNLRTNLTVPCKIFQVNSANNVVHYVKLEFLQPSQGFWGVHFPSDPLPIARKQENAPPAAPSYSASPSFVDPVSEPPAAPTKPASPSSTPERDIFSHAAVSPRPVAPLLDEKPVPASPDSTPERDIFSHASVPPRPAAPLLDEKPELVSPSAYASPSAPPVVLRAETKSDEMTLPPIAEPAAPPREASKPEPPKEIPAPGKTGGYGLPRNWQKEQIEPLAGPSSSSVESAVAALIETPAPARHVESPRHFEPAPAEEKIPVPGRRPQPAPPKRDKASKKPVRPVFGELHTFNSPSSSSAAPALHDASLTLSSVARSASPSSASRLKLLPALTALCILTVIAAGVMYVRRHPSLLASSTAAAEPVDPSQVAPAVNVPQPNAAASAEISPATPSGSSPLISPAVTPAAGSTPIARNAAPAPKKLLDGKSSKAAAETDAASNASTPDSSESTATVIPNLYAGDLNARPKTKHAAKRLDARPPDITVTVPGGAAARSDAASLSSIVPGADSSLATLAPPAAPEPVVRLGGDIQQPKLLSSVAPVYPGLAKLNNVQGDVIIQAMIGISGNVTSMKVVSGPSLLRDAAMSALRKWRYAPAKLDGKPIAQQYVVTIRFRLGN